MASNQQFCLRWNNHQSTLISVFDHLLESGTLVDCTLAAEGQFLKAHKVVLSACSPYLEALLSQHYEKHPILILKDVTFHELKSMLDYMYRGEVNISQEQLGTFLKAAESLQIKGLTDSGAISESRDFERTHDLDRPRDINRLDRSIGASKRMEIRKQISRSRSPLFGLLPNLMMNVDGKKVGKNSLFQEISSASPTVPRNREGSLSPTNKRKRYYPPHASQNEEQNVYSNPLENNHHEEHHKNESKNKESPQVLQNVNSVSNETSSVPTAYMNKQINKTIESENLIERDVVKHEVKSEHVDYSDEVLNDDSVENLTVDEEEEEMDEADLSKPGPSNVSNSHVAGVPWHISGEGNGEEILLAGQQESQDDLAPMLLTPDIYARLLGTAFASTRSSVGLSFNCPRCGNTYARPHSLSRHIRFECGVDPKFECPICHKKSKHKHNLMLHMRTHQNR